MDHPYLVENRYHEWKLDTARFVADLLPLLGGQIAKPNGDGDERRTLVIGQLRLLFQHPWENSKRGRVEVVTGSTLEVKLRHHGCVRGWPKASFDASRPLDQLAKEIRARLIEPSASCLTETRRQLRDERQRQRGVREIAAEIRAEFPNVSVEFDNDLATEGKVYCNGGGAYLSARLTSDGGLYVDRVGSLSAGRVMRFLAALAGPTND